MLQVHIHIFHDEVLMHFLWMGLVEGEVDLCEDVDHRESSWKRTVRMLDALFFNLGEVPRILCLVPRRRPGLVGGQIFS